jgi:5-methylcytosine-specific restriction endonuclease McrA
MKRSRLTRKTPLRPVLKKSEAKLWQRRRAKDAEALLREIRDELEVTHGYVGCELSEQLGTFVLSLKTRPKRRYRTKSESQTLAGQLKDTVNAIVFKRDDYACLRCGATKESGAVLQGAHILSQGANRHMAYDPDNVMTLCRDRCHITSGTSWHKDPDAAMEWFREHFGENYLPVLKSIARERKGQKTDRRALLLKLQQQLAEMP